MAFMGMFLAFLAVVLVILGISAIMVFACFLSSGLIMVFKRRKNKNSGKIKTPWYVIMLRIIGGISALPMVIAVCLVIYGLIANAVDKKTNLARSVMSYDYEQAEEILQKGADPDVRDKYGRTLLMCLTDHEDYVSADNDYRYECASSHLSNDKDDIRMMELLLEYGADINEGVLSCGDDGNHIYMDSGWHDIYANSDHYCGNTPLIFAVRYRSDEVVEFLIENGADVNKANACGFTPLLMCADMRDDHDGGPEIAGMLIGEGADPNAVTNFHQDIIWLLMRRGSEDIDRMAEVIESAF